jgi:hypothetical protein
MGKSKRLVERVAGIADLKEASLNGTGEYHSTFLPVKSRLKCIEVVFITISLDKLNVSYHLEPA